MKKSTKDIALWLVMILLVAALFKVAYTPTASTTKHIGFSEMVDLIQKKQITKIVAKTDGTVTGDLLHKDEKGNEKFETFGNLIDNAEYTKILLQNNIPYEFQKAEDGGFWKSLLVNALPLLLFFFIFFLFMRQMQAGGGKALSFGKSKARMLNEQTNKITFKNVAGIEEAKSELEEIIEFLKEPKKFTKLGGRIPKGVLLMGSPGTGKTLLAKAIAGEAGVPFFSISGSDFVEMFVGVGASRVRDLFEQGKKNAPCIIFIDEIDAVGRLRGAGLGGGHDEREQTLNQLLVEMDGFESNEGVIIIAASNRPDVLDPALLRPGRFDRRIVVPKPDVKGREEILKVHTTKTPIDESVNLTVIARGTPGFSGADLENLVNEAALLAARTNKEKLDQHDFEQAKDKVLMGAERRSLVISEEDKKITAYHEAGHALVGKLLPCIDPIHKVTIIPRGMALGLTQTLPMDEKLNLTEHKAQAMISFLLGGRIAEEMIFNHKSTGAGNDIERATGLARKMVCEWGMSEKLGPLSFGGKEEQIFLGREISQHRDYSESTAQLIDKEIRDLIEVNYKIAKDLLHNNIDKLHSIANALLEKEVIDGAEIEKIVNGVKTESDELIC